MASAYLILISVSLTASQTQGQVGSCPLNSCSLVNQVNICINGTSGGCSESCTTALMSSSTVEECCNRVVESLSPPPTSGGTCGEPGARTEFGELLDTVNNAQVARGIHAGIYIVSQTRNFVYSCSGCIKSIQLAVSTTSVLRNAQGQERIKFHTFANRTGDKVVFQRTESLTSWISSVNMAKPDRLVVDYRPNGSAEVCFSQGDVFGFTIEEESGINLMTRPTSDIDDFVLNATNAFPMSISGCPQLYTTGPRTAVAPLIHIVTGPGAATEVPSTITELPTTESTTQATAGATPDPPTTSQPPSPSPTIGSTGGVSPSSGGYLIYAAAGIAGVICILLIVVIVVVVICIVQRKNHNNRNTYTQHGGTGIHDRLSLDNNEAYGVSNHIRDVDHMDNNETYGISTHIGIGDHMDSNEAYGVSIHIGVGDNMDSNEAYGVRLQQNGTQQEFEENLYDYPMVDINHIDAKANEAYATAVVHL